MKAETKRNRNRGWRGVGGALVVAVLLFSGLAAAWNPQVNWVQTSATDGGEPSDRWSYTRTPRPTNALGVNGQVDNDPAPTFYWDWETGKVLWGYDERGYGFPRAPLYSEWHRPVSDYPPEQAWEKLGCTQSFECIDDDPVTWGAYGDDDITRLRWQGPGFGAPTTVNLAFSTPSYATITNPQTLQVSAKKQEASGTITLYVDVWWINGGTPNFCHTHTINVVAQYYLLYSQTFPSTCLWTGQPWTVQMFNSLQLQFFVGEGIGNDAVYLTNANVDIDYVGSKWKGEVEIVGDTSHAPVANTRRGACVSWDGNVPGWWSSGVEPLRTFLLNRRPNLFVIGGEDPTTGVASGQVNMLKVGWIPAIPGAEASTEKFQGEWIDHRAMPTPAAYSSCGRYTIRCILDWGCDDMGVMVFGGKQTSTQTPLDSIQRIKIEFYLDPGPNEWKTRISFITECGQTGNVGAFGPTWGAAIVDEAVWGPLGEQARWYLWGGGPNSVMATVAYVSSQCDVQSVTEQGNIPSRFELSASVWSWNVTTARTQMLMHGGLYSGTINGGLYSAEFQLGPQRIVTWTLHSAMSGHVFRYSNTLYCGDVKWNQCNLPYRTAPLSGQEAFPRYYMTGGICCAIPTEYEDVWMPQRYYY